MPSVTLNIAQFRAAWWKRPAMIGVAGGAALALALGAAAWTAFAPRAPMHEGVASAPEPIPALRSFTREGPDERTLAAIAQNNPLAASRLDFIRETVVAEAAPEQNSGERDRLKRLDDAQRALANLRLVAILRVSEQWIALFEPAVRKIEEDLLSLRTGDVWQGWTIDRIDRQEVRAVFEGHTERIELKPRSRAAQAKAPPRGRARVETRPVTGREVSIDPPITPSEARQRLLGATRDETERVRRMAEDLLKDLDNED